MSVISTASSQMTGLLQNAEQLEQMLSGIHYCLFGTFAPSKAGGSDKINQTEGHFPTLFRQQNELVELQYRLINTAQNILEELQSGEAGPTTQPAGVNYKPKTMPNAAADAAGLSTKSFGSALTGNL